MNLEEKLSFIFQNYSDILNIVIEMIKLTRKDNEDLRKNQIVYLKKSKNLLNMKSSTNFIREIQSKNVQRLNDYQNSVERPKQKSSLKLDIFNKYIRFRIID